MRTNPTRDDPAMGVDRILSARNATATLGGVAEKTITVLCTPVPVVKVRFARAAAGRIDSTASVSHASVTTSRPVPREELASTSAAVKIPPTGYSRRSYTSTFNPMGVAMTGASLTALIGPLTMRVEVRATDSRGEKCPRSLTVTLRVTLPK